MTRLLHTSPGAKRRTAIGMVPSRPSPTTVSRSWSRFASTSLALLCGATAASGQTLVHTWYGALANSDFGSAVADAGDVDNDGIHDVIVGAPSELDYAPGHGSATVFSGATGLQIHKWMGAANGDRFGNSVCGLGDVNGDGYDDVAVGVDPAPFGYPPNIGYVKVFSGQTGLALYTLTGSSVSDVFGFHVANLGDVENDGTNDLGVTLAHLHDPKVEIRSGGTGALLHTLNGSVDSLFGRSMVGMGDLNSDGYDDFALGTPADNAGIGHVTLYAGNSWAVLHTFDGTNDEGAFGWSLANMGDLDGDAKADLAVGIKDYWDGMTFLGAVYLYSSGSHALLGSMLGEGILSIDQFGFAIAAVHDESGDGKNDLLISSPPVNTGLGLGNNGRVYLVRSAPTMTILDTLDGPAGAEYGWALAGVDVTADGKRDFVIGGRFAEYIPDPPGSVLFDAGIVEVFTTDAGGGSGGGSCSTTLPHYAVGDTPRDVLLIDRDADGDLDVVTANSGDATLSVLTNDGAADLSATPLSIALTAGDDPISVARCGNGGSGLAVACPASNTVRILTPASGSWSVSSSLTPPGQRPVDLAAGDLDGVNGPDDDLAIALEGSVFGVGGGVAVRIAGVTSMLPAPAGGFLSIKRVAIADLDGDGDADLVAARAGTAFGAGPAANVLLYRNDGGGAFTSVGALEAGGVPSGFAIRDLDGDGDRDLVTIAQSQPPFSLGSGLKVFRNIGTGALGVAHFTDLGLLAAGSLPSDVAIGDLDADSHPGFLSLQDVVVTDTTGSTLEAFRSFGATSFAATADLEADDTPVALAIGDLNGDSAPDIVVANAGCGGVTVTLGTLGALAQKYGTGCAGTAGKVPAIAAVGSPTFGNPSFGVRLTDGRAGSFVFFGVSLSSISAPLGGCTLLISPPLTLYSAFTNGLGQTQFNFGIPAAVPPFVGMNAYFQYFVNDPVGGYSGFAFSDALRIRLGN